MVRIFPNRESCLRLVTALAMEQSEEWITGRRYLDMEELGEQRRIEELIVESEEAMIMESYGNEEAWTKLQKFWELTRSLGDLLMDELYSFVGEGWEQEDDITLLTLRRSISSS